MIRRRAVAALLLALTVTVSSGTPAGAQDPAAAREAAREVLAQERFRARETPRPFREPLRRLGDAVEDGFAWVARRLPGGEASAWTVLGALVLLAAAVGAARLARRQGARGERARAAALPRAERASDVRRAAAAAERAGDLDQALRLHFRAGLLELDAAGVVAVRPGMRNGDIVRAARSPTLRDVAARVERVAYGGRPASADDVSVASGAWARVREEAAA